MVDSGEFEDCPEYDLADDLMVQSMRGDDAAEIEDLAREEEVAK